MLGTVYLLICVNGAPRVKYLSHLGATAVHFGIIAGIGAFVLAFQLVGSIITNSLRRRKVVCLCIAIAHRLCFIPLLLAPLLFADSESRLTWIIAMLFMHDALAQTMGPIWLSWMADLVPVEQQSRYWAARQRFITAVSIIFMVVVAFGFDYFERRNMVVVGFTVTAGIGVILGVVDLLLFRWVPEPQNIRAEDVHWREIVVQPLRDSRFRRYIFFMGFWHFAIFLSAPFFHVFMIGELKMSVLAVQLVSVPAAIGVVLTSRFWGLLCDTYGYRPVLQILTFGKAFTPLAFLLMPPRADLAIPLMAFMLFFDGILNSGCGLACQGVMVKLSPRQNRTMYIAAVNFFSIGIFAAIAPVIAGTLIDFTNTYPPAVIGSYRFNGFHLAFFISFLLRMAAVFFAARISEPGTVSLKPVLEQIRSPKAYRAARLVYKLHEDKDTNVRLRTLQHLTTLQNPMAIGELIHSLKDSSHSVRDAAAQALGHLKCEQATQPLARALRDASLGIQSRAAEALGRIGGIESLQALLNALRMEDPELLGEVVDSLGRIGDSAAIVPLICLFHDVDDANLRLRIAMSLGKLSDMDSAEEILELLQEGTPV